MEDKSVLGNLESIVEKFQSGFVPVEDMLEKTVVQRDPKEDELDPPVKQNRTEPVNEIDDNEDTLENIDVDGKTIESNDQESEYVSGMFEIFAEQYGWDIGENVPKSIESLLEYVDSYINENAKVSYADDKVKELDEFVRNGGKLEDFISVVGSVDYGALDMTSEQNLKRILTDLFKRQGLTEAQIERKLNKYELADILQDEAEDAVEALQEMVEKEKVKLLSEQAKQKGEYETRQLEFYNNVINEVDVLKEIRGVKVPEQEKKELLEYIFKPTKSGKTQYQEDYASSITNLVESAYFTKNKNKLIDSAKKVGEKTAVERFKQKLKSGNAASSKKPISSGSARSLWEII